MTQRTTQAIVVTLLELATLALALAAVAVAAGALPAALLAAALTTAGLARWLDIHPRKDTAAHAPPHPQRR